MAKNQDTYRVWKANPERLWIQKLNSSVNFWDIVCFSTSISSFQILNSKSFRICLLHLAYLKETTLENSLWNLILVDFWPNILLFMTQKSCYAKSEGSLLCKLQGYECKLFCSIIDENIIFSFYILFSLWMKLPNTHVSYVMPNSILKKMSTIPFTLITSTFILEGNSLLNLIFGLISWFLGPR